MNVNIIGFGTLGDIQPFVALGKGLQAAGHRVKITAEQLFEGLVRDSGLEYGQLRGLSFKGLLERVAGSTNIMGGKNSQWLLTMGAVPMLKSGLPALGNSCYEASEGADCMIYAPFLPGLWDSVAEKLNVPFVLALLQPMDTTSEFPFPWIHPQSLGAFLNRSSYYFVMMTLWPMLRPTINTWRKGSLRLPPLGLNYLVRNARKPILRLYGFSPSVIPIPHDWTDHHVVTGYWFLDRDIDWEPSQVLVDFLNSGQPPVCAGFGSMIAGNPEVTTSLVIEALDLAKQRGILLSGWGGFQGSNQPEGVLCLDWAPHKWLLPRCSAVIHHGGAGTTAAGLRAGIPSIIVPFTADQPFWGRRVFELGVGPEPIPRRKLTAAKLAKAIVSATACREMKDRARKLAKKLREENGIKNAVEAFDRFMNN
ncbi:glycosyltransferase family 1 protein [bacterium]|nr:glycosyltransferase family 1 protein [bacterium]